MYIMSSTTEFSIEDREQALYCNFDFLQTHGKLSQLLCVKSSHKLVHLACENSMKADWWTFPFPYPVFHTIRCTHYGPIGSSQAKLPS